jgi:hypothetical protein
VPGTVELFRRIVVGVGEEEYAVESEGLFREDHGAAEKMGSAARPLARVQWQPGERICWLLVGCRDGSRSRSIGPCCTCYSGSRTKSSRKWTPGIFYSSNSDGRGFAVGAGGGDGGGGGSGSSGGGAERGAGERAANMAWSAVVRARSAGVAPEGELVVEGLAGWVNWDAAGWEPQVRGSAAMPAA